jgi:hypothetical protein
VTITEPCVSLSTGTLSPDKRVNYVHGMVLGLGEFLQEQQYFLQKGYLRQRSLVGFGTAYGLEVSIAPTPDVAGDFTVTVAPGMAIDQSGRELVITSAQCARLGAWLGEQERATPGTIAAHRGPSGELTVHTVVAAATCLDDLVPLPGQPCARSERTKAASRIRDAWDIQLTWDRPAMPRWDTDRRIARLLDAVEVVEGLDPVLSSEAELRQIILQLPALAAAEDADDPDRLSPPYWPPVDPSNPSGPIGWRLPAAEAADAVDRLLTLWVTRVRPELQPPFGLSADAENPGVLLSAITFTTTFEGDGSVSLSPTGTDPVIEECLPPDDEGRPYLLHTQLIQELAALGGETTLTRSPVSVLATLTTGVDPSGQLVLTAWFRLDQPVLLTGLVRVDSRDGQSGWFLPAPPDDPSGAPTPTGFSDTWVLTPTGAPFAAVDGDQVAVTFVPAEIAVGEEGVLLSGLMAGPWSSGSLSAFSLLDTTATGDVVVYGTVEVPLPVAVPEPPPPPPPPTPGRARPVYRFVDTIVLADMPAPEITVLECWFHPQPSWPSPVVLVTNLPAKAVRIVDERSGRESTATFTERIAPNVWQVGFRLDREGIRYYRLLLPVTETVVTIDRGDRGNRRDRLTVAEWADEAEIAFLGADPDAKAIADYVRMGEVLQ